MFNESNLKKKKLFYKFTFLNFKLPSKNKTKKNIFLAHTHTHNNLIKNKIQLKYFF